MAQIIERIEALIHPDYSLSYSTRPAISEEHQKIRARWDQRVSQLASYPGSALLYFSPYFDRQGDRLVIKRRDSNTHIYDLLRIQSYVSQLEDRLLLFAGFDRPSSTHLQTLFLRRGFTWYPNSVHLAVYGEYYDRCVEIWGDHLKVSLGVTDSNYSKLPDLSLNSDEDINRSNRKQDFNAILDRARNKMLTPLG